LFCIATALVFAITKSNNAAITTATAEAICLLLPERSTRDV
jgi:hypothetical protein